MVRLACVYVDDLATAEEVVQESFLGSGLICVVMIAVDSSETSIIREGKCVA